MAKNKSPQTRNTTPAPQANQRQWLAPAAMIAMLITAGVIFFYPNLKRWSAGPTQSTGATSTVNRATPELYKMNVAQAVMVTVELDFGGRMPTIAQALEQVERSYAPDDGVGRTFAILDAYGNPTLDGQRLHMSMHVSSEKPGLGFLKFRRSGELLWQARIGNPGDAVAGGKSLNVFLANGAGGNYVLDGARGGDSALDVFLQNSQQRARDVWPDGAEREVTFVYSACGCPVKVMVRREGDRTKRTSETPVIFPDDPAAIKTISNLMKW